MPPWRNAFRGGFAILAVSWFPALRNFLFYDIIESNYKIVTATSDCCTKQGKCVQKQPRATQKLRKLRVFFVE